MTESGPRTIRSSLGCEQIGLRLLLLVIKLKQKKTKHEIKSEDREQICSECIKWTKLTSRNRKSYNYGKNYLCGFWLFDTNGMFSHKSEFLFRVIDGCINDIGNWSFPIEPILYLVKYPSREYGCIKFSLRDMMRSKFKLSYSSQRHFNKTLELPTGPNPISHSRLLKISICCVKQHQCETE